MGASTVGTHFDLEKQNPRPFHTRGDQDLTPSQHRNKTNKLLRAQLSADSHYLCLYDAAVTGIHKFHHHRLTQAPKEKRGVLNCFALHSYDKYQLNYSRMTVETPLCY